MRNLKKFLALALAMVMTFSLMLSASASNVKKTYGDSEKITKQFTEAVDVLTGLGVFQGDEGGFRPADTITRAEVAAIVYRIATGDVDDNQVRIYADYGNFTDVAPTDWFAGYVGYCSNAEIIKGTSATTFDPYSPVTGYQALAMILRAVGYDKNHEFDGAAWQTNVASLSKDLGVTNNVKNANFETTLSYPATREVVADLLFQAAAYIPTVTYTSALGYNSKDQIINGKDNPTLGEKIFDLDYTAYTTVDDWGRPGYYWFQTTKFSNAITSGADKNIVATIVAEPEKSYTTTQRECDVAHDLGIDTNATFDLYVNDKNVLTNNYLVEATDTITKVGGQGRLTEVYRNLKNNKMSAPLTSRVVMVDTFLAQVTGVSNAVLDAAGHVIVPAKLTVSIYDRPQATAKTPNPSTNRIISKGSTDATNWEYSKGDMILLNAYTDHNFSTSGHAADAAPPITGTPAHANAERAAFEYERVAVKNYNGLDEPATNTTYTQVNDVEKAKVLGVAKSIVAQQTVVYWNQDKHNVDGTDYNDQLDLFLDVAGTTVKSDFTWYFDQYGNIIGIGEAIKSNYGVITSIYSSFSTADGATDGKAVAKAHVKLSDGTEADITIDRFLVHSNGTTIADGHQLAHWEMTMGTNSAEMLPVYDYSSGSSNAMIAIAALAGYTKPAEVQVGGQLPIAPVASINKDVEAAQNVNATNEADYFGIIEQNLFKFVTSGDGKMTAIEIAGGTANGTAVTGANPYTNDGPYINHWNDLTDGLTEMKKNIGFLALDNETVRMDNSTQIMLKEDDEIKVYNGLNNLPGNIEIANDTEVDWVDYNDDGIADVVYTTATIKGSITYGLFYYVGGAAQWNGVDKKGTLAGWLGGEPTVLEFDNENEFNHVKNSVATYKAHLFAVEMTNGVVTNLMGDSTVGDPKEQFLKTATTGTDNTVNPHGVLDTNATTPATGNFTWNSDNKFVGGVTGGNDYTTTTKAVWFYDDNAATATTATFDAGDNSVTLNATKYYLTPGVSKTVGSDLSYLNRSDYKNDITIVFETNGTVYSIVEIYVTTMPDNTTSGAGIAIGSDVPVVPASANNAAKLETYLKNMGSGVWQSKTTKMASDASVTNGQLLYFAFTSDAGAAQLTIQNSAGVTIYSETGTIGAAGGHVFWVNTTGARNPLCWIGDPGFTVDTYSYDITVGGTSVGSGSFTIVAD